VPLRQQRHSGNGLEWEKILASNPRQSKLSFFISTSLGKNYFREKAENGATPLHTMAEPLDV
jgi:hypothetical protein